MDRARATLFAMASLPVLAAGCSGGSATGDGSALATGDSQFMDCSLETRATPYSPGLVVRSTGGQLDVTLVDNRPGTADANNPPGNWVKGSNTWDLKVADTSGTALPGLALTAMPKMPDHNHGTSITPVTTDEGGGSYVVSPLYLYMGGYWRVTLDVRAAASDGGAASGIRPDSAIFNVCIPD
jgi:hypothetical protein